jgi:hypothetical protein
VDNIAEVVDIACAELRKIVVAESHYWDTSTMWGLHTHFVHHPTIDIEISPRLSITSPTPECGKTTLMEAVGELSHNPVESSSITASAFFRMQDAERCTLLIDEAQSILGKRSEDTELRSVLLASHRRRSAKTHRTVEVNGVHMPQEFDAWCTFAMTYTGKLNYAIESRCIQVVLKRAKQGEVQHHLRVGTSETLVECRRKFARWAHDQMSLPEPDLPKELYNRRGDNWRPLFQVAAAVGGHWPEKIRAAALQAMKVKAPSDVVIALLTDLPDVFWDHRAGQYREKMLTHDIAEGLISHPNPSMDWKVCYRGRPVNAYFLREALGANLLVPPGSQRWRVGKPQPVHGYLWAQFQDALDRYDIQDNHTVQPATDPEYLSRAGAFSSKTSGTSGTPEEKSNPVKGVSVPDDTPHPSGTPSGTPPSVPDPAHPSAPVPDGVPDTPEPIRHTKKRRSGLRKSVPVPDVPDGSDQKWSPRMHIEDPQPAVDEIDETW